MFPPVYLDHNATTPLCPAVLEAMLPWLSERFGNPSSSHGYGRVARRAVEEAREKVAAAVGAQPSEVVFVASGSEANNLFIKGALDRLTPGELAVGATEHPCVIRPAEQWAERGWRVWRLPVTPEGILDAAACAEILARKPALVSVMRANNETGVLQDVSALAAQAGGGHTLFHTDAVQALGKIPLDFRALNAAGVHAMTLSAHKLGGPKGAAALIVDKRVSLAPLVAGGGHERGRRAGTENVAALVGFGEACERAAREVSLYAEKTLGLRSRIEEGLVALGARIFGRAAARLPNTVCFAVQNVEGETLVSWLDRAGFAVSSGSACSSDTPEPSQALRAMGVAPDWARGAVRVSVGASNTVGQAEDFLRALREALSKLTALTAVAVCR